MPQMVGRTDPDLCLARASGLNITKGGKIGMLIINPDTNGGRRLKTETRPRAAGLTEIEIPPIKSLHQPSVSRRVGVTA